MALQGERHFDDVTEAKLLPRTLKPNPANPQVDGVRQLRSALNRVDTHHGIRLHPGVLAAIDLLRLAHARPLNFLGGWLGIL
jgi:hypothetical protein